MKFFNNTILIFIIIIFLYIFYLLTLEWTFLIILSITILFAYIIRYIEMQKINQMLEKSHESALENMTYLVNLHDKETGEHILRTKHYTKAMRFICLNIKFTLK